MSTNPFGDPDDDNDCSDEIIEGFLCPICHADLKSIEFLSEHFARLHAGDEDVVKSLFKDIFFKAKNKILPSFDNPSSSSQEGRRNLARSSAAEKGAHNANDLVQSGGSQQRKAFTFNEKQLLGVERNYFELFSSVRNARLERYANESNKLLIRLCKLIKDMPLDAVQRKQHEQNIVTWLDGSSVKLCPNCARSFHIARRQHHCRLCGSILCADCSQFLSLESAKSLARMINAQLQTTDLSCEQSSSQGEAIRLCSHCMWLLKTRQDMHESSTYRPPITHFYAEIQKLRSSMDPDVQLYLKIVNSLLEGESLYNVTDASALRSKVALSAEDIDKRSKRIQLLPCAPGSREEALHKALRLSCIQLIKEQMLSLPPLPQEDQITEIRERKRIEAEQRIQNEQQIAMKAFQRLGITLEQTDSADDNSIYSSDVMSLNHWTASQVNTINSAPTDDPLVEQINIIKNYIRQARTDGNLDVVDTLESNLRELQSEYYERQKRAMEA